MSATALVSSVVGGTSTQALASRIQMGASLGFHIVFACFGIAMPLIVLIAHRKGLRGDPDALLLARRWSKVMTVLFAVGAVSGTVLSYELGLLWPGLMGTFGPAFGIPFSIEGVWFFVEAIFTGIYVYGWGRLPARLHWWSGVPLVVAGLLGAFSVVSANSWMNQPSGFVLHDGRITHVDPWAVIFNAATPYEVPHMVLAAYMVAGFTMAGVYAVGMLRGRRDHYHRLAFGIPFAVAAVTAPLQMLMGDEVARAVAEQQPLKFAAMELVSTTHSHVTEWLGGIRIGHEVHLGVGVPDLDSLLVGFSPDTTVTGLDSAPPALRPPLVNLLHLSFDAMVGIGTLLLLLAVWQGWRWWRRREILATGWFLVPVALSGVAAVVAMELGWIVTEVGRQPWVVYGILKTADAVTPASGVPLTLAATLGIYAVLTGVSLVMPWLMGRRWRRQDAQRAGRGGPGEPERTPDEQGALTR